MLNLIGLNGKAEGEFYTLMDGKSTIGRDADNHISIDDASFSTQHVEITVKDDHFFGKDLESTNGCTLNKVKFHEGVLKHNDLLCVGSIVFKVIDPREVMKEKAALEGIVAEEKAAEEKAAEKEEKKKVDEPATATEPPAATPATTPAGKAAETPEQKKPEAAPVSAGGNTATPSEAPPAPQPVSAPPPQAAAVPPPVQPEAVSPIAAAPMDLTPGDAYSTPDEIDPAEEEDEDIKLPEWVGTMSRMFLWLIVLALFVKHILNIVS